MKNIGNSILNSSCAAILKPIPFKMGFLQVVPDYKEDTHRLVYFDDALKQYIASHPNGYSCHCLAERIVAGDSKRIQEQADYIIRCGGTANLMSLADCFNFR